MNTFGYHINLKFDLAPTASRIAKQNKIEVWDLQCIYV